MRRRLIGVALVAATAVAASMSGGAAALAGETAPVVDCNTNGQLTRSYSRAELQTALNTMGADVKEYTDCYDVIQRALLGVAGARGTPVPQASGGGLPTALVVLIVVLGIVGAGSVAVATRRAILRGRDEAGP